MFPKKLVSIGFVNTIAGTNGFQLIPIKLFAEDDHFRGQKFLKIPKIQSKRRPGSSATREPITEDFMMKDHLGSVMNSRALDDFDNNDSQLHSDRIYGIFWGKR